MRPQKWLKGARAHVREISAIIRGKITKKFSIAKYKYQQICTKCVFFAHSEYKKVVFKQPGLL